MRLITLGNFDLPRKPLEHWDSPKDAAGPFGVSVPALYRNFPADERQGI